MREFVARWKDMFIRMGAMPVSFLGVGLYRAWLATFFRYEAFPTIDFFDYALFEGAIGVASFAVVLLSRRITPLWSNNALVTLTAIGMVGGSALCVVSCFWLQVAALKYAGLMLAGAGLGLLILMWTEFFGSLNPMRVAVYYAGAIVLGEALKWLFGGLDPAYIAVFSVMLPLASIDWVRRSMKRLPDVDLPKRMGKAGLSEVPWKPILLMGVCTFATGFGVLPDQPLVVGNVVGTVLVAAFVIFGVLSSSRWFNFDTIYQLAFPFMTVGLLLIAPQFSLDAQTVATCYDAGYTMLSIFIMIVLSNITYRFGRLVERNRAWHPLSGGSWRMELVRIWLVVLAGGIHEHASYRDRCICGGGVRNPVFHRKKAFREVGHQSQGGSWRGRRVFAGAVGHARIRSFARMQSQPA